MKTPKYAHVAKFLQNYAAEPADSALQLYIHAIAELANEELRQVIPDDRDVRSGDIQIIDVWVYGFIGKRVMWRSFSKREPSEAPAARTRLRQIIRDLPDDESASSVVEQRLFGSDVLTIAGVGIGRTTEGAEYSLVFHHPDIGPHDAFAVLKMTLRTVEGDSPSSN